MKLTECLAGICYPPEQDLSILGVFAVVFVAVLIFARRTP